MRELSIAMRLVEIACEEAHRLGDVYVTKLLVRLGPLSGVVPEALAFSFDFAVEGSAVEGAQLVIEPGEIVGHCPGCAIDRVIPSAQVLQCPICYAPVEHVVSGRELELVSLEIEDRPEPNVSAHR